MNGEVQEVRHGCRINPNRSVSATAADTDQLSFYLDLFPPKYQKTAVEKFSAEWREDEEVWRPDSALIIVGFTQKTQHVSCFSLDSN